MCENGRQQIGLLQRAHPRVPGVPPITASVSASSCAVATSTCCRISCSGGEIQSPALERVVQALDDGAAALSILTDAHAAGQRVDQQIDLPQCVRIQASVCARVAGKNASTKRLSAYALLSGQLIKRLLLVPTGAAPCSADGARSKAIP